MQARTLISAGAVNLFIAIAGGAFGAHALKQTLSPDMLAAWHTAALYQMVHGLGLLALGAVLGQWRLPMLARAGWLMLAGIVLFSGSLYALALTQIRMLGAITPIGGVAFLLAWAMVAWAAWTAPDVRQ